MYVCVGMLYKYCTVSILYNVTMQVSGSCLTEEALSSCLAVILGLSHLSSTLGCFAGYVRGVRVKNWQSLRSNVFDPTDGVFNVAPGSYGSIKISNTVLLSVASGPPVTFCQNFGHHVARADRHRGDG